MPAHPLAPAAGAPRRGTTLAELVVVLTVVAVLLGVALPLARRGEDRRRVHGAALHVAAVLSGARTLAVARGAHVAVAIDTAAGILRVLGDGGGDTLRARDLGAVFGVRLAASRDSLAYDARGLGVGAANLTLVVRRGAAAETLAVSRLGRLRW